MRNGRTGSRLRHLGNVAALAAFLGAAPPLQAHDLWIEPTSFSPKPGQVVGAHLRVGVDLLGDPVPRIPALVNQFVVADSFGRRAVPGRDGADPAGVLRVARPGLHIVGYHSNASRVELPAEKFNAYLQEEGLDAIVADRARRGESSNPARELFYRCAKSLLSSGPPSEAEIDQLLGFPLELVAERNPYALPAGEELSVRLLYQGQPLAGALVVAMNRSSPAARLALRSDAEGRVRLPLRPGGMWLVKAVHMVAAPAGAEAEWASYWASLTFGAAGTSTDAN